MPMFHDLKIKKIINETDKSVIISFIVPKELSERFVFIAGQFISIKAIIGNKEVIRDYSICSHISEDLSIGVKKIHNGLMSSYLNDKLKSGDSLSVSEPKGNFKIKLGISSTIAIAAGSGITPIMSMLKSILFDSTNNFYLIYSNKSSKSTMFLKELNLLKKQFSHRLFINFTFTSEKKIDSNFGRITKSNIFDLLDFEKIDLKNSNYYLCGPEMMINDIKEELIETGIINKKIFFELFVSNKENEKIDVIKDSFKLKVVVDEFSKTIEESAKKTILDAALDNDIDVPYSCNGGVCGSCIGKIVSGNTKMLKNSVLTDSEISDGLVLACQSIALSSFVEIDFDDV